MSASVILYLSVRNNSVMPNSQDLQSWAVKVRVVECALCPSVTGESSMNFLDLALSDISTS